MNVPTGDAPPQEGMIRHEVDGEVWWSTVPLGDCPKCSLAGGHQPGEECPYDWAKAHGELEDEA